MSRFSPVLLLRTFVSGVAVITLWIMVSLIATPGALVLGAVGTAALLVSLLGELFFTNASSQGSTTTPTTPTTYVAPHLGETTQILTLLQDAVIAYDKDFKLLFANPSAERLFGVPRADLEQFVITPQNAQKDPRFSRLVQIVYPSLAPVVIQRSESGDAIHVVDLRFSDPELDVRVSTIALPDGNGFLKIIRDRTRTLSILRSKGEFVTVASHQIRTPLTEVSWALETLAGLPGLDETSKEIVAQSLDSVKSLVRTAEDLLGVAKIEEGRFGYHFAATDIVALLDKELAKALPIVEKAGLRLYFDRPTTPLPPVHIDSEKVVMVINNLVENAMRYNVANGEITVRAEVAGDTPFVKVSVKDTGIGIAPADVDKLFTKFFRADNAQKAVAGGTGLGLYILRNIVRAHGGTVGVDSELGRGSTFYFTLATDERRVPQHEVGEDII